MEISNEFELRLPPDEALDLLLDLERVTPCLPGAQLGDSREDGGRELIMTVKLGPMKFAYEGWVSITETDRAERRAVLTGNAAEKRGQGDATAKIEMHVTGEGERSTVAAVADVQLTGKAAQNGRGIVEDVSARLIAQMAQTLDERYGREPGSAPAADAPVADAGPPADAPPGAGGAGLAADAPPAAAAPVAATPPAPAAQHAPAAPVKGGRLLLSVLWRRFLGLFRRST
ncbi:MAG: uncharacterized protein QOK00_3306 [Thermoleophilaceae bacterium]|jgi:carbon monoxide dehydrogenase subunit G|nr:uncharacterized protein [Thermoleophilaceae bacterium]